MGSGRAVQWPALEERLSHLWLEPVGEGLEIRSISKVAWAAKLTALLSKILWAC
jgi:hypothetical protein